MVAHFSILLPLSSIHQKILRLKNQISNTSYSTSFLCFGSCIISDLSELKNLDTDSIPITAGSNIIFTTKSCKNGIVTLEGQLSVGFSAGAVNLGTITDSRYYPKDSSSGRSGWTVGNSCSTTTSDLDKITNFVIQNSNGSMSAYAKAATSGGYLFAFVYQAEG